MPDPRVGTPENPARVETLHDAHPRIRAKDWRSALVARLTGDAAYFDGDGSIMTSYRPDGSASVDAPVHVAWSGLSTDYDQCRNTYQAPLLTEFAALAVACILCQCRANIEITEVTRRGEKVDYWLGNRELLLEVSGTQDGNIESLCSTKAAEQLQVNPFRKDGFVCVARFEEPEARLWFFRFPKEQE